MKRVSVILAALLICTAAIAQEKKAEEYNTSKELKSKVFEVHNRDTSEIMRTVALLGSGFKGAAIGYNDDLHTITVRDFPENIAAIEGAIARLDHPITDAPDIVLKISVLIGSKTPLASAENVPDELAPVVKQLQSTLSYAHYGLMTATVQRTRPGDGITGSGVAEQALLGMPVHEGQPLLYTYHLRRITATSGERPSIDIENFAFSMRVPITVGAQQMQYQSVGFDTPVSIRQNEKVVIGTTTMGDKALIVVVTATITPK